MQINAEMPLAHIIGVELRVQIPGRSNVELKCFDCNIPLPPDSTDGKGIITGTLHTTEGDIQIGGVNMIAPALQPFKVKGYIAEEMLHRALNGERSLELASISEPVKS